VRLATLHDEYGGRVTFEWRNFLLQPTPRSKPLDRFIAYTQRWVAPGGPADNEPGCGFRPWTAEDPPPPTHSLPPAVAGRLAAEAGRDVFERFHLAAMGAYFVEHRTISEAEELADIAGECGLDRARFLVDLRHRGGELQRMVLDDHTAALDAGVHAVPSVGVNGFAIPGAQDLAVYRRMIDRLLSRR